MRSASHRQRDLILGLPGETGSPMCLHRLWKPRTNNAARLFKSSGFSGAFKSEGRLPAPAPFDCRRYNDPLKPIRVFASDAAIYVKAIVRRTTTTATTAYPRASERSMVFTYASAYSPPLFRNANAYSAASVRLTSFRNATNCDMTIAPSYRNYQFISWRALLTVRKGHENSHRF